MKPSYIPGYNINLPVAHWYGISCMLDGTDTALGQYIADEIAGLQPHVWHTVYGLSYEECKTITIQLNTAYEPFRNVMNWKSAAGYIRTIKEEQSRAEVEDDS